LLWNRREQSVPQSLERYAFKCSDLCAGC